ncbi:MAG: hypothetical protein GX894_03390 [Clostridia bacterium]|nr:hypothetical protein [Clostridia bacterium]
MIPQVKAKLAAETDYTPTPRIYRGFPAGEPPKYQAALEVLYDHRFSYSKEVLGFIQWTGVEFFQFLEGEGRKDFSLATGCGFRAAYRIIGIKPLYLGVIYPMISCGHPRAKSRFRRF